METVPYIYIYMHCRSHLPSNSGTRSTLPVQVVTAALCSEESALLLMEMPALCLVKTLVDRPALILMETSLLFLMDISAL